MIAYLFCVIFICWIVIEKAKNKQLKFQIDELDKCIEQNIEMMEEHAPFIEHLMLQIERMKPFYPEELEMYQQNGQKHNYH